MEDDWHKGTLNKTAIWALYIIFNGVGICLCSVMCASVRKMPNKTSNDILLVVLCSGCIWMSTTCLMQCTVSVAAGYFFGGAVACTIEAFFHVSGILVQFFSVGGLSLRNYFSIVHEKELSVRAAAGCGVAIWILSVVGTVLTGIYSDYYLMSAGTYCFFGFSSYAIAEWLVPGLILAIILMTFSYISIVVKYYRLVREHDLEAGGYSDADRGEIGSVHPDYHSRMDQCGHHNRI